MEKTQGEEIYQMGRAKQFVQEDSDNNVHIGKWCQDHILTLQPLGLQQLASTTLNIPTSWTPQSAYNWEMLAMLGRVLLSPAQNSPRDLCRTLAVQMTMSQSLWYCGGSATQSLTVSWRPLDIGKPRSKTSCCKGHWSQGAGSELFLVNAAPLTLPGKQ